MSLRSFSHWLLSLLRAVAITVICSSSFASSCLLGGRDCSIRSERVKYAEHLLAEIMKLGGLVQSPRPNEVSWVEAERAEIKRLGESESAVARTVQLLQTPEFQQVNVYSTIQEVRKSLDCIINRPRTLRNEFYCWAVTSYLLGESAVFYDGILVLVRANRLSENLLSRTGVGSPEGISLIYGVYSKNILQSMIIPYLRGDLD